MGLLRFTFRGMLAQAPCWLTNALIRSAIVAKVSQHHCARSQSGQKHGAEPIVMCLARREAEAHRQSVRVDNGMNLTGHKDRQS